MHMLLEIGEDLLLLQFVRSYIIAMVTVISLPLVHCYQLNHVHLSLVLALFFTYVMILRLSTTKASGHSPVLKRLSNLYSLLYINADVWSSLTKFHVTQLK